MNKIKVAIVEDVDDIRQSLKRLIHDSPGFTCTHTFTCAEDAIIALPALRPDVVIMDLHLPGKNGVQCVAELKPQMEHTQFMMYSVYDDDSNLFDALSAGANGYML